MGVIDGEVRAKVRVDGDGTGPKVTTETAKGLESMKRAATGARGEVVSLSTQIQGIKSAAKPLDEVRGTFEMLRSNLGFVAGAVTGVVAGVGLLVSGIEGLIDLFKGDPLNKFERSMISGAKATQQLASQLAQVSTNAKGALGDLRALEDANTKSRIALLRSQGKDDEAAFAEASAVAADKSRTAAEVDARQTEMWQRRQAASAGAQRLAFDIREREKDLAKIEREIAIDRAQGRTTRPGTWEALATTQGTLLGARAMVAGLNKQADEAGKIYEELGQRRDLLEQEAAEATTLQMPEWNVVKPKGGKKPVLDEMRDFHQKLAAENAALEERARAADEKKRAEEGKAWSQRWDQREEEKRRGVREGISSDVMGGAANDNTASGIAGFASYLSESLPGMERYASVLAGISGEWGNVAAAQEHANEVSQRYQAGLETQENLERARAAAVNASTVATIKGLGAMALAGAEGIKNDRLRAGIQSTIYLGMGTALMFVPGMQEQAGGYLAGAGILAGVALFGGGKSSGVASSRAGGGGARTSLSRPLSRADAAGGQVNVNFFGGYWAGSHSAQEMAGELSGLMRRGQSGGFALPSAA